MSSSKSPPHPQPTPTDLMIARLVSHCWHLFPEKDKEAALLAAFVFGSDLADEVHGTNEEAYGDAKDYRRVLIHTFAFETCKVINDIEVSLWRSQDSDPRVGSFERGFKDRMRELRGKRAS